MNRRGFFGTLLGLAATPLLYRIPVVEEPGLIVVEDPIILPPILRDGVLLGITMSNSTDSSLPEWFRVMRGDGSIVMQHCINMLGSLCWRPMMPVIADSPIVIDVSNNLRAVIHYRDDCGTRALIVEGGRLTSHSMYLPIPKMPEVTT